MTTAEWALDCTLLGWVPVHDSSGRLLARAGTAFAAARAPRPTSPALDPATA
jgi:hypothetical protein